MSQEHDDSVSFPKYLNIPGSGGGKGYIRGAEQNCVFLCSMGSDL